MNVPFKPKGLHSITPNTIVDDVDEAIAFYQKVFGAEEVMRLRTPDGRTVHCELQVGDSRLNLAGAMDGWPAHPLLAQLFVPDSDAVFDLAVKAGAKVVAPVADMFFGSRDVGDR